jgi:hypothetical protein
MDDYSPEPYVLRDAGEGVDVLPDARDLALCVNETAGACRRAVRADEQFVTRLPWCLTNHAAWLIPLAQRFSRRPEAWRGYLRACIEHPAIERAVPTRLARVAVAVCDGRADGWALLASVAATVERSIGKLPPIELVPTEALLDIVLGVRAAIAQVIRLCEIQAPQLVGVAEVLGIVRLLRHASAVDLRSAYCLARHDPDTTLRILQERARSADLRFEHTLTAMLRQPTRDRLLAVAGRAGFEALRYTRRRYDVWLAQTGSPNVLNPISAVS